MHSTEHVYLSRHLKRLGFRSYRHYTASPAWVARRREYFEHYARLCDVCGKYKKVVLHHRTYVHLGSEADSELIPLCNRCQRLVHHRLAPFGLSEMVRHLQRIYDAEGEEGLRAFRLVPEPSRRSSLVIKDASTMSDEERAKYALARSTKPTSIAAWQGDEVIGLVRH